MFISRMQLDARKVAAHGMYGIHQNVWRLFADSNDRERDFIYRQDGNVILSVSHRSPLDESGTWLIETKEYAPIIAKGETFTFSLRVNPVVKSRLSGKWQKHDAVQHERKKRLAEGCDADRFLVAQEVAVAWLQKREERLGFCVTPTSVLVDNYLFNQKMCKAKGKQGIISTLDLQGLCTVTDAELFKQALFAGIGSAKGFGCGLLLVRRH